MAFAIHLRLTGLLVLSAIVTGSQAGILAATPLQAGAVPNEIRLPTASSGTIEYRRSPPCKTESDESSRTCKPSEEPPGVSDDIRPNEILAMKRRDMLKASSATYSAVDMHRRDFLKLNAALPVALSAPHVLVGADRPSGPLCTTTNSRTASKADTG